MTLSLPTAVIFDWDNTLVDSWTAIAEAMNAMRQELGYPVWSLAEVRKYCTRAARDSFPEWFGDQWEKAYDIYYRQFDAVRRQRAIATLAGAQELLLCLKANAIPSFVVSNKRGDYLRIEAEKLQWTDLFVAIVGAQDSPCDKPARDHVDYALNQGGLTAGADIWFVGDSETDIICARNAGCTPILIGPRDEADRLAVEAFFSDCRGLHNLLTSLTHRRELA